MKLGFANKFLISGFLLYFVAGITTLTKMNYGLFIVLGATIFLALGLFLHTKRRWIKLFKQLNSTNL